MKAATWKRISGPIGDVLPDFRRSKRGFVRSDEWIATCVMTDSSRFSADAFYVNAFALPRFIPTQHIYLDYGFRIGDRWDSVTPELVEAVDQALPRLSALATLDGLRAAADRPDVNVRHVELHLCIAIIEGDQERFSIAADVLAGWTAQVPWEQEILDRCQELIEGVRDDGFPAGLTSLEQRREAVDRLLV